jgi:hypothetical protein
MERIAVRVCLGVIVAAGLIAVASVSPASAQNLLLNSGFEDGDTGPISGSGVPTNWYAWGPTSGWHHDDAGKVIDTKAIKFWWDDVGVWQDVTVAGGNEYAFSVMAFNAFGDRLVGWNGLLKAEFYNSALGTDPAHLLAQYDVDRFYSVSDPTDQWVLLTGVVTAPANADVGRIQLKIADWQSTGVGGSLNFDEASIMLVPEPASLMLLALGAVALVRRRGL